MSRARKGLGSSAMPAIAWVGTPIAATDDRLHRVDLGQRARNTKVLPTRNRACTPAGKVRTPLHQRMALNGTAIKIISQLTY